MKKLLLIIISFLYIGCYAQKNKLQEGIVTVKGNSFVIGKSSIKLSRFGESLYMWNTKNKYTNGSPHPKNPNAMPVLKSDMNINDEKIKSIINQVLQEKNELLKVSKEVLSVLFIFEQNGKISDIAYSVHGNTNILADEIEQIDTRLRNEIKAKFKGPDYLNFPVIHHNLYMRFY